MDLAEKYRRYVEERSLYGSGGYPALDHRCRQVFKFAGTLEGKSMLEIGGGEGLFALWALTSGLSRAILLEPEGEGSMQGVAGRCAAHKKFLGIDEGRLMVCPVTIQEYDGEDESFDLVLSYSSVNHLDELACGQLDRSEEAERAYLKIFEKVFRLLKPGGSFVISDAGRRNLWSFVGLRSPFCPTMEWNKHQEPQVWSALLKKAGFQLASLEWHRFYPLRWLGRLGSNAPLSKATTSQFILTVRRAQ